MAVYFDRIGVDDGVDKRSDIRKAVGQATAEFVRGFASQTGRAVAAAPFQQIGIGRPGPDPVDGPGPPATP